MDFTGEQVNTYGLWPEQFFKMDATMAHLPVDVLTSSLVNSATMRVKLCSLLPMVNASGSQLTRAETVTLLNDLCVLAPAALVNARITWTSVDDHRAQATFTRGDQTVTADLLFNEQDQLVDFGSDDGTGWSRHRVRAIYLGERVGDHPADEPCADQREPHRLIGH